MNAALEHEKGRDERPEVEVVYLNTNEEAKFHAAWENSLQHVWDRAYVELGETRREGDEFQCQDGHSLMSDLHLTLAELREKHICQDRKYAIRSATGGA